MYGDRDSEYNTLQYIGGGNRLNPPKCSVKDYHRCRYHYQHSWINITYKSLQNLDEHGNQCSYMDNGHTQ